MTTPPHPHPPGPPPGCPAHPGPSAPPTGHPPLHGPGFAADPDATYAWLRTAGPAHFVELAPGVEAVLVTGYDAALEVLRSPYFSKDARRWTALAQGRIRADNEVVPMMGWRPSLWFADGEAHLRLRASVDLALSRINPHRLRAHVQHTANELIDGFASEGSTDLVARYADPLPAMVLARLLGCPGPLGARMATACRQMIDAEPAVAQEGGQNLAACLAELVAAKRSAPGADVTSWLLEHPSGLSDTETVHQLVVLIGAGSVPQSSWISTATMMLLADDRFAVDLTGGTLTVADALNEVLWRHSPLANFSFLYATQPYPLRDPRGRFLIPTGVPVLISHAAANTDPTRPAHPEQRVANHSHLAFGAGRHACPARGISGVIAETAIELLLDRLPDMQLSVPGSALSWRPGPFHRALAALPVRFTPAPAAPAHPPTADGGPTWKPNPASPSSTPPVPTDRRKPRTSAPGGRRRRWNFPVAFRRGR
ncbi:cytochrome P450 [Streptomyces calidiresistens]